LARELVAKNPEPTQALAAGGLAGTHRVKPEGRLLPVGDQKGGRWFLYSIKKEGDSRIFHAQDRAIDDFTLKGKSSNGSIDKF
jgi:hypothetical protein